MKHLCLIHFEYTHYVGRTKVVESCRLLEKHIKKYCAGHGQLLNYYNDYEDYVESTLWTEEDDIKDVLNAMMQNLPDGVMREGLKGYFSYTGPTLKDLLGVITKSSITKRNNHKSRCLKRSRLFPPPENLSRTYNSN